MKREATNVGRVLLMIRLGGHTMVTYDSITAFATVGLLIVAIVALFLNKKK